MGRSSEKTNYFFSAKIAPLGSFHFLWPTKANDRYCEKLGLELLTTSEKLTIMATLTLTTKPPANRPAVARPGRVSKSVVSKQSANSTLERPSVEDLSLAQACDIDALYNKYAHRSLAFLDSRGLNNADAEDVLQQAWIRIYKSLQSKPFEGNFRAWLFQILRNAAIDCQRKKKPESFDPALAQDTFSTDSPPDAALIESEYQADLKDCMNRLDDESKRLLTMRLGGEDYSSIAAAMSINVQRAHRLFFDVKTSMTKCLSSKGAV